MVQINLLPDVKRDYIRAQQMKHMFIVGSVIITVVAVTLLGLLFAYVQVVQPRHKANLQTDIDSGIAEIKSKDDAVKIVTVQGVLEQLPALQDQKLISSNLFTYLTEFTPRDVSYSEVQLDLSTNILTLSGQTTTLERANVLANNLKSAKFTYTQNDSESTITPFSSVVFGSLGKSQDSDVGASVSFQINFQIDPVMFNQAISKQSIAVDARSEELALPTTRPFVEGAQ